jgi:O-methyltransferase
MDPLQYAKSIAYSTVETLRFTYDVALEMSKKQGVYIECGVAAGAQIIAMAYAAPNKTIYAFDSFQGIPLPSNRDDQMPGLKYLSQREINRLPDPGSQLLESSGATVVSLDDFKDHCVKSGVETRNIKPVRGWFEETVPNFQREKIAILRLDGDLYNSTMVCLKYLFDRVIEGGYVIIDDWSLSGCRSACDDYFGSIGYKPDYKFISNIAYFIK